MAPVHERGTGREQGGGGAEEADGGRKTAFWAVPGPSLAVLGVRAGLSFSGALLGHSRGLLWPSWGSLEELSGLSGAPLEPSWASLDPSWSSFGPPWGAHKGFVGRPGAILGASCAVVDAVEAKKADIFKNIGFP